MFIILVYILSLLFQDPPRLYVVPSVDTVYPGQVFTVGVYTFGDVGSVEFDSGGLQVVTDTLALGGTRYVWLRASGPARDVRVKAKAGALEASAVVRICCRPATFPIQRVFLPILLH
jgi:hypothetical protein